MTQVDFYLLAETTTAASLSWLCRLLEKAYQQNHRVLILAPDETIAHQLDEKLWTYREDSFIPHNLIGEGLTPAPPIQISAASIPKQHRDILINLTAQIIDSFQQFRRLIEVIPQQDTARAQARERYRYYREQGCQLQSHDLTHKGVA